MTNNWVTIIVALISGGYLLGIAAIITSIAGRRKSKADALSSVESMVASQLKRADEEAERWRDECLDLKQTVETNKLEAEDRYAQLSAKIDELEKEKKDLKEVVESNRLESETCQTQLTIKIEKLEREKKELIARVEVLEAENARLKAERGL